MSGDPLVFALQVVKFLADERLNQKEKFSLRAFHDYLWKNGKVPILLLRWEYLELAEEIETFDARCRNMSVLQYLRLDVGRYNIVLGFTVIRCGDFL